LRVVAGVPATTRHGQVSLLKHEGTAMPGKDSEGATSVEYALMAGLIAVAIAVSVGVLGQAVVDSFDSFATAMGW
jgi:pilus assembly protein Flp/PilA